MHNITRLLTYIIMVAAALGASAQSRADAYSFLNMPMSTRIYGLGGVNITLVDDDVTTIDQNPALLGQEMAGQLAMSYMRYVGESNFAGVRYAFGIGERGALSAAVQYYDYGKIIEADNMGNQLGDFSPKDAAFMVAYSHDITDNLRGGINLKMAYSAYSDYSAFALATDLGINYFDPDKDLSLSLVLANLGGQIKRFNESYDRLPFDVRVGWSQSFGGLPLRFSVTAWNLTRWKSSYIDHGDGMNNVEIKTKENFGSTLLRHLVFGIDLVSSPNWYLGIGYNYKTRTDMQTYQRSFLSGFSLSGGLRVKNFGVGLAFSQPHTGATTFMLNLTANLNELL